MISATLTSQFGGQVRILDGISDECGPFEAFLVGEAGSSGGCEPGTAFADLPPGQYAILVSPVGFFDPPCGSGNNNYTLEIECTVLCDVDGECDDGDPCTDDECEDGECLHFPTNCDDGDLCNGTETCDPAEGCQSGTPIDCDDGDECTADECVEGQCAHSSLEQALIIKQGACPASVNPNSNGVIPMLLVGDVGFDVNNVDLGSLSLRRCDGAGGSATPLEGHFQVKDLNHPPDGGVGCGECACNDDQSSDGIDDLSLKFRTDTTLAALGIGPEDGVVTLELVGQMMNGTPFCSRDCVVVVPPGAGLNNAMLQSNMHDTFVEVTPLDLNLDSDGFADFTRSYVEGTTITATAPVTANGQRFLRWNVDGEMQAVGVRTIEVTVTADTTIKALYRSPGRLIPVRPTEQSGDID